MAGYLTEQDFETAPVTYQEWLDCFRFIREHPENHAALRALSGGTVCCVPRTLDMFLQRLDELLQETIRRRIAGFLSRVDALLEENDPDGVELEAIRFCRGLPELFFFESLGLPEDCCRQFSEGYAGQLDQFWRRLVSEFRFQADETHDARLEDLAHSLAQLRGVWCRKGMYTG